MLKALALCAVFSGSANAWTIGSQLDNTGCHEKITTEAFRATRAIFDTAPAIAPTRDESALISEVQFGPPADFQTDLAAMALLLGVRDNDLKGNNPLDSLQLVQVHGNPDTQEEHCIRAGDDDGSPGDLTALARCREFIHDRFGEALEGLGSDGVVDGNLRVPLAVYVAFAGRVHPMLPQFYVQLGQAVHALEDSFTHTYRTSDGLRVTTVTNWIDYVSTGGAVLATDGPPHLTAMDHCENNDPLVQRNFQLATIAATEMMKIALDPARTVDDKMTAVDVLLDTYLTYEPGCTVDNNFCNAPEPGVPDTSGCSAASGVGWLVPLALLALILRRKRRSQASLARGLCMSRAITVAVCVTSGLASAQPVDPQPQPEPAPAPAPDAPAIPPTQPAEAPAVEQGHEPGRDEKTPTVAEVAQVRADKELGSPFGFSASLGGGFVHGGFAGTIGGRYRLSETWSLGLDAEWNPWVTGAAGPLAVKAGTASVYATVIHRYPMKLDRVNLRTTLNIGASTLLFDVYGAPKYDIGPFVGLSPLGIDYDLGGSVRLVFDPLSVAVPIPHIGLIPLYYEQFRTMIGIQIGG